MSPVGRYDLGFKIKIISKLLTQNMNNSITSLDLTSSQARVAWLPVLPNPTAGDGLSAGH